MDNQEKIFEKIKKASRNQESGDFPSMEKVWSRVGEKLDKKVLKKENTLWKKAAIAASFLLLLTLSYEVFRPETQPEIPKNQDKTAVADTVTAAPVPTPAIVAAEALPAHPSLKPEAEKILKQQIETQPVAVQETTSDDSPAADPIKEPEADFVLKSKKADTQRPSRFYKGKVFDAIGVQRKEAAPTPSEAKTETQATGNTQAPLVILDGKAITGKEAARINTVEDGVAKVDPDGDKEVVILREPLYIINGHYYSEEELFGPNPTSPYAPLNQQEIETILVLEGEKAVANYGKRGEKGVVVITTKDRKPASASKPKAK